MKPVPYPADTRAKGWGFELRYERIEQSTTWGRAKPEARAWLLMLWLVSWKMVPCGSLPNDLEAIAGHLGIPDDLWERHSETLMRGWWLAEDGRLYHDTLIELVVAMMEKRRSDRDRQHLRRHRVVTRDTSVTPPRVGVESNTDNRQPVGVPSSLRSEETPTNPLPLAGARGTRRKKKPAGTTARFADFWLAWPKSERKQDKAKCEEIWAAKELDAIADTIITDVRKKRGTTKWQDGFIEMPATYLNNKRWEDGTEPDGGKPGEDVKPWWDSVAGVTDMGLTMGLGGWDRDAFDHGRGEEYSVYRARVLKKAREKGEQVPG